jgi:hypothetical protein
MRRATGRHRHLHHFAYTSTFPLAKAEGSDRRNSCRTSHDARRTCNAGTGRRANTRQRTVGSGDLWTVSLLSAAGFKTVVAITDKQLQEIPKLPAARSP